MLSSSLSMIFIYIAQIPASVPSTLVKLTKSQGIHLITIRASHNHTDKVPTNWTSENETKAIVGLAQQFDTLCELMWLELDLTSEIVKIL